MVRSLKSRSSTSRDRYLRLLYLHEDDMLLTLFVNMQCTYYDHRLDTEEEKQDRNILLATSCCA
jgi:hypothetical protein